MTPAWRCIVGAAGGLALSRCAGAPARQLETAAHLEQLQRLEVERLERERLERLESARRTLEVQRGPEETTTREQTRTLPNGEVRTVRWTRARRGPVTTHAASSSSSSTTGTASSETHAARDTSTTAATTTASTTTPAPAWWRSLLDPIGKALGLCVGAAGAWTLFTWRRKRKEGEP